MYAEVSHNNSIKVAKKEYSTAVLFENIKVQLTQAKTPPLKVITVTISSKN